MKFYTKAHGAKVSIRTNVSNLFDRLFLKTTNLIINLDHDELILDDDTKTLAELGFGK